ncbi:hypothetical protein [Solemya elarraichensis gill symbiont]|nr:hypothetical protein [Solemya elarraichensis gill symbiont]
MIQKGQEMIMALKAQNAELKAVVDNKVIDQEIKELDYKTKQVESETKIKEAEMKQSEVELERDMLSIKAGKSVTEMVS